MFDSFGFAYVFGFSKLLRFEKFPKSIFGVWFLERSETSIVLSPEVPSKKPCPQTIDYGGVQNLERFGFQKVEI